MGERVLPFGDPIYQEMCRAVALGSVRGPYTQVVDGVPQLDIGAVVAEIIASPALAEVRREAAEEAWDEGAASVGVEVRPDPKAFEATMRNMQVRTKIPANPYRRVPEGGEQ